MNTKPFMRTLVRLTVFLISLNISHLQASSHRIISTDASATNLLVYLGMQDQLIAIDVTSTLPDGFKALPNIGYHRNLSAEGLLSLNPSIVLGSELMGPSHIVPTLEKANIHVVQLPSAKTALALKQNIQTVSTIVGRPKQGKTLNKLIDQKLVLLEKNSIQHERVAFLLSMDPNKLRLAGKGTNGEAIIHLLGAKNVAEFENYQNVSAESLLALKPTVIVVAGKSKSSAVDELLAAQSVLKFSPAGRDKNIISIDGSALVAGLSVSSIDEALSIAETVHAHAKVH